MDDSSSEQEDLSVGESPLDPRALDDLGEEIVALAADLRSAEAHLAEYTNPSENGVSEGGDMGRTNIVLDDVLVERAMRLTGARSKREVVDIALRRLVEKGELYRAIRALRGRLAWDGDVGSSRSARGTISPPEC